MTTKRKPRRKAQREWSPKVNDPRQGDWIDWGNRNAQREGFAKVDESIESLRAERDAEVSR